MWISVKKCGRIHLPAILHALSTFTQYFHRISIHVSTFIHKLSTDCGYLRVNNILCIFLWISNIKFFSMWMKNKLPRQFKGKSFISLDIARYLNYNQYAIFLIVGGYFCLHFIKIRLPLIL